MTTAQMQRDKGNLFMSMGGRGYERSVEGLFVPCFTPQDFSAQPKKFDLVMFSGGADVMPELYGDESPRGFCGVSPERDRADQRVFNIAISNSIKMVGICRGVQFLNVMAGGKMIHHMNGHAGPNHIFRSIRGEEFLVTSTHHQMCIPPKDAFLLGESFPKRASQYIGARDEEVSWDGPEVEALYFPKISAVGVQYHPEYMDPASEGYRWFHTLVKNFVCLSSDEFEAEYLGES